MLRVRELEGNRQRLDGGALFGNAPKALWQRWCPADEHNRVELACRALLVQDAGRMVLLETGIGAFFSPELRQRYGIFEAQHVLLQSLADAGLSDADIDVVILSHLHFDHAGGLLSAFRAETEPTLLFPKARFVTSQQAFDRARTPHQRDRASFIPSIAPQLLASGRLSLVDEGQDRLDVLGDRFRFTHTNGHTPGMLHTTVVGTEQRVFFCADLVPGLAWLPQPITMGYDRFAERVIDEKTALYPSLAAERTWLFFTHDPHIVAARIEAADRGRYQVEKELRTFATGYDLDEPATTG